MGSSTLTGPSGDVFTGKRLCDGDAGTFTLAAGSYTLTLQGVIDTTGTSRNC